MRHLIRLALILLVAAPAAAQGLAPQNDRVTLRGPVFQALGGGGGDFATVRDARRVAQIRAAMQPFRAPLALGGETITLNQTGLLDLVRAWGAATALREGEVAVRTSCWASAAAGTQAAFVSALETEAPYRVTGWSLAHGTATPRGCTATPRLPAEEPALPHGLSFGMSPEGAERAIGLPPTYRRGGDLAWSYDLPAEGFGRDWTDTVRLRLVFEGGRLAAAAFSSLVSN